MVCYAMLCYGVIGFIVTLDTLQVIPETIFWHQQLYADCQCTDCHRQFATFADSVPIRYGFV